MTKAHLRRMRPTAGDVSKDTVLSWVSVYQQVGLEVLSIDTSQELFGSTDAEFHSLSTDLGLI